MTFRFWIIALMGTLLLGVVLTPSQVIAQERGDASYYSDKYDRTGKTASGEIYDRRKFTAAHRTLPFQTWVKVTNLQNGRSVKVRINDRGPFKPGRIIDVSGAAAEELDMIRAGVVPVRVDIIAPPRGQAQAATPQPTTEPVSPQVDLSELPIVDAQGNPLGASEDEATPAPVDPDMEKYTPALFRMIAYKAEKVGFAVQVGAFFSYYRMLEAMDALAEDGLQSTLVQNGVKDGKPIFRILVGPFDSRREADAAKRKLAKQGTSGIVISLRELN